MTHRRYLSELAGQIDPQTGLSVMLKPPFDFEYQVRRHLAISRRQWPWIPSAELENSIRKSLRVGQAWLWPDSRPIHQMELFA